MEVGLNPAVNPGDEHDPCRCDHCLLSLRRTRDTGLFSTGVTGPCTEEAHSGDTVGPMRAQTE